MVMPLHGNDEYHRLDRLAKTAERPTLITGQVPDDAPIRVDEADVVLKDGSIDPSVQATRQDPGLQDLVSRIPDDYEAAELD